MDLKELIVALDVLVLEQRPDGRFDVSVAVPRWCREVRPTVDWDQPLAIDEIFPFLTVFLPEAERAWKTGSPSRVESELWAETGAPGTGDAHFVAAAARVENSRVLLVIRGDGLFRHGQAVLQRARELRITHASLMKEIEQKDILVHAIVHDLAAPLHSIIGVLSLLDEAAHGAPEADWIRMGIVAANRQRELIAEILDVFSAEAGAAALRATEDVDLGSVIDRVVAERAPVARMRELALEIDRSPELHEVRVAAEETRLFRVITNLVDNAFRHSPRRGIVRLSTHLRDGTIELSVDDDGPGVVPDVLPRLFEKFARGRERGAGTGLGLFFCRISVENWGGGIGYERRDQGGARFWIRLNVVSPRARRSAQKGSAGHGEAVDARR